jgi:hypothetical protein
LAFSHLILLRCEQTTVFAHAIFAKKKARKVEHKICLRRTKTTKGASMEYLILVAVVSMIALYALIIVGCLKQSEW